MSRNSAVRFRSRAKAATFALALGLTLVGCGSGGASEDKAGADDPSICENFPSKDIEFVVPYAAGGGFDAWARLMAPYIKKNLGGSVDVRVVNVDGGGGMRAMNDIYAAKPDGTKIIFTEPGFVTVNQILGRTTGDFDLRKLTFLGQATVDPQVFAVSSKSKVRKIGDLKGKSVIHAGQDISPIETITYDTFGVKGKFVLHDATSETVLALRRGDSDITVTSLSSILDYLKSGELRPILFVGTEKVTPELLGYEQLKGVETITEAGHPELGAVLEQYRVVAAPPELPDCMVDKLGEAVELTLKDQEFIDKATKASLRVIPAGAKETQARVGETYSVFEKYSDALERAIAGS